MKFKKQKILLYISLSLNFLFIAAFFIGKRMYYTHQGYINSHPHGSNDSLVTYTFNRYKVNEAMVKVFQALPHSAHDIVFIGTSLTQGFPLQELFNNLNIKNRGIGGNTSADILARLSEALSGKPAKLFIEAGTNDVGHYHSTDTTYNNIVEMAKRTKSFSPTTKIYINSILPLHDSASIKFINDLNHRLNNYCATNSITFVNLHPYFSRYNCQK